MSESEPTPRRPMQRFGDRSAPQEAQLAALAQQTTPAIPNGPVAALADQLLVHTAWDTGRNLITDLPDEVGGLVLRGAKRGEGSRELARSRFEGVVLIDPEGYTQALATPEKPFVLPSEGLFDLTLEQVLDQQRQAGATAALTPTGYIPAGDEEVLKAAADIVAALDRDDTLFSVPLDVAWFTDDNIDLVIAVLARLAIPKAVFIAGQFDPMERYNAAVWNLRRLAAEAGHVSVLRTDLTGMDIVCHGAFAASIGTGGSLRHTIPFGEIRRGSKQDPSPSVLYGDLMTFYKGSTLAERFANATPPSCACPTCCGRGLDRFLGKGDAPAAHGHSVQTWSAWLSEMRAQSTLGARAAWWKYRCANAVAECEIVNSQIGQDNAFKAPATLQAWASLPAWVTTVTSRRSRSNSR